MGGKAAVAAPEGKGGSQGAAIVASDSIECVLLKKRRSESASDG